MRFSQQIATNHILFFVSHLFPLLITSPAKFSYCSWLNCIEGIDTDIRIKQNGGEKDWLEGECKCYLVLQYKMTCIAIKCNNWSNVMLYVHIKNYHKTYWCRTRRGYHDFQLLSPITVINVRVNDHPVFDGKLLIPSITSTSLMYPFYVKPILYLVSL